MLGAASGGCRDQAAKCAAGAASMPARYPVGSEEAKAFVAKCAKEEWTDKQITCVLRAGDGMLSAFCFDR